MNYTHLYTIENGYFKNRLDKFELVVNYNILHFYASPYSQIHNVCF